jgi:hypothetical protein
MLGYVVGDTVSSLINFFPFFLPFKFCTPLGLPIVFNFGSSTLAYHKPPTVHYPITNTPQQQTHSHHYSNAALSITLLQVTKQGNIGNVEMIADLELAECFLVFFSSLLFWSWILGDFLLFGV